MRHTRNIIGGLGNLLFKEAYLHAQMKKGNIPDVYLQDEAYFKDCADEIRARFSDDIGQLPYVSIHVRRGDYVGNPFYVDLAMTGYYIDAINHFPNDKFIVFSDDIDFAKFYFEGDKFTFDDSPDEIEAFNKMASCKHNIIANSSFSWWAAWLNPNPDKKVIAPKAWHTDEVERTKIPETWIKI